MGELMEIHNSEVVGLLAEDFVLLTELRSKLRKALSVSEYNAIFRRASLGRLTQWLCAKLRLLSCCKGVRHRQLDIIPILSDTADKTTKELRSEPVCRAHFEPELDSSP